MELLLSAQGLSLVLGALLAISEVLSLIPSVRSNGLFQVAMNVLRSLDLTGARSHPSP